MSTDDSTPFERLRAADPAADAAPDLDRIRATVAAATGVPLAGSAAPGDELAGRRRRTRTRWLQVAAVVAGVAVVGTGGYLVGDRGAGGTGGAGAAAGTALPAISLQGGSGDSGGAEAADAPMAAGASAQSFAADGRKMMYPGFFGRTVFTGQGLSTAGGSATAWGFDATAIASADTATRLAGTLGVAGDPRTEWGSWVVGPNDGSGPTVSVAGDGMASFSYYDPTRDPWLCQAGSSAGSVDGSAGSGAAGEVAPDGAVAPMVAPSAPAQPAPANPSVCRPGSTPTGDAAAAKAREVLASLGIETGAAHIDATEGGPTVEVQVQDDGGKSDGAAAASYVYVTVQQVIDGQLTGVQWSVSLVGDGVQSVSGPLAPVVQLGSYDVVSPAQAVDRLGDPRFGSSGGVMPLRAEASVVGEPETAMTAPEPSQEPTVPPAPVAGAAISWPVQQVTLTSSRLGLALVSLASGAQVLVPAYELSDAQGTTWSVVAVADAQLDFTAAQ